jgi:hypothetical protein
VNDDEWLGTSTLSAVRLNDALERAERAEAALQKARENAAFSLERRDVAEARLAELVRRAREELEYWRDMRTIGNTAHERFDKLLKEFGDKYDGGEHG